MPGHVFHPGHAELHGITVVVETQGSRTYIGRYDSEDEQGLHLLDVAIHDADGEITKEEYIRKSAKFGVRSQQPHVLVPANHVYRITRLGEVTSE
jgi:fructose-specific phosphotransferase system component IIB